MHCQRIVLSAHALRRLFERGLTVDDVAGVLQEGEIIAHYPDDAPYPSMLVLGYVRSRPLHVVVGQDPETQLCVVITAYEPDRALWSADFRQRRS